MRSIKACRTFSPRVVGDLRPDYHCLQTLLSWKGFAGKSGEELVLAIYDHFTSTVDGTYHFWPPGETEGNPRIRRSVRDPIKLLNAYGWAICGQCAGMLYSIYRAAGLPARQIGLPGHSLCEVFYDGRWHILDVDMWTWFRTPQGHIAGACELARNAKALILDNPDKSDPCDLPDRPLPAYAQMYEQTQTVEDHVRDICPPWSEQSHSMDFQLRPGETLIRSQAHQGRFHMPQDWKQMLARYDREWIGHPRERYEPFRTFGNGRWVYEPDMSSRSGDFAAGLWEPSDLAQDEHGLVGPGTCTFGIRSPYPFCGRPDWRGEKVTHADGVWLELAGQGALRVELTDAEGKWAEVLAATGDFQRTLDITALLSSRYDCLIRLSLKKGAALRRFRFDGVILTAPLSIPRLAEGDNELELRWGDKLGRCTLPWSSWIDFRSSADLKAQWVRARNAQPQPYVEGWQQIAPAQEGPVSVIFRFPAPSRRRFLWAYVHASLREGPVGQPPRRASLDFSSNGRDWKNLTDAEPTSTHLQWDVSLDGEAVFARSMASVYVRLSSQTPISGLEFHGHLDAKPPIHDELEVLHQWKEDSGERSFTAPAGATRYTVRCGPGPREHTLRMSVPSRRT